METYGHLPSASFEQENPGNKSEKFLGKIKDFKDKIAQKLGLGGEELTKAADEALVDAARETISSADQDGERTDEEKEVIHEAVSSVVVQGAMETAGYEQSSGENPILSLDQEETEADLVASIATLHEEDVALPTGEDVAELAVQTIEDAKWSRMKQVDRAHGTNEGGWYEYPSTGERYYVKFYRNPDQGRVEYIANSVYEKLGIKAVQSEIVEIDGRQAVAAPEVVGARECLKQEQQVNPDVQKGFVADAFLANWDVIGQQCDNIVRGDDGLYRIDNGGSLIFRAQGGAKEYSPNNIPELESMRDPRFTSGEVFNDITDRQIREQAQYLLDNLSEDDIREIVEQSGLEGEVRDQVLTGMLGRREYLAKLCAESPQAEAAQTDNTERHEVVSDGRLGDKLRQLHEMGAEQVGNYVIFPRSEITCDRDHIEGQKLNLYDKSPAGRIEVSFKLREGTEAVYDKFSGREDTTKYDAISCWHMSNGQAEPYALCGAISFKRGDVKVFISEPDTNVRTAHGLVKIEAPSEMPADEIEKAVADIMENDLEISDALNEVSTESAEDYKRARYAWEHRVYEMHADDYEAAGKLESAEVAPGYTTMVEPGKHKEYEAKYGEMCAYHVMYSEETNSIVSTLTSGLLCSSERYQRGIFDDGMSTPKDLKSGGGDSVFTRVSRPDHARAMAKTTIVFKPELFDRTDWYAYDCDRYGSTEDDEYQKRITPDQLFSKLADNSLVQSSNEQMFRTGIGADYIQEIRVNPAQRDEILAELHAQGVTEIVGRSVEEIVVANENYIAPKPVDPSMEEDWGDGLDGIQDNLESSQQSNAQMKEDILAGTVEYPGIEGIFDICETPDDVTSLFDAVAEHGQKDKLKTDLSMFIIDNINNGIIGNFLDGGLDSLDINAVILGYAKDKLDVDLNYIMETKQKWNK